MVAITHPATLRIQDNCLVLTGQVDFNNVATVLTDGLNLMQSMQSLSTITVNLKDMIDSDSSGLALLIAWIRAARQDKKPILFLNMPKFMNDLAIVSGVDKFIQNKSTANG